MVRHNREEVIERTVQEFEQLDRLVAGLSESDWLLAVPRPESKDPWSVKDALAHIALRKADFAAVLLGLPRPAAQFNTGPTRGFRLLLQHWREQPPEQVLAFHRQVQQQVLFALRSAPESSLAAALVKTEWPNDLVSHSSYHRVHDIEKALSTRRQ